MKRKRFPKPILFALICMCVFSPFPMNAIAADILQEKTVEAEDENTEETTGYLAVFATYSEDVDSKSGDIFAITIAPSDDEDDTYTFTVDASEATSDSIDIELTTNTYTVLDIEYTGDNNDVINGGYGVRTEFKIIDGDYIYFNIYIGASQTSELETDYPYYSMIKDGEHDENGERVVYYDENGAFMYVIDEDYTYQKVYLTDVDDSAANDSSESSSSSETRYYDDSFDDYVIDYNSDSDASDTSEEETKNDVATEEDDGTILNSIGYALVFVGIIAVIGGVIAYILHKKGSS